MTQSLTRIRRVNVEGLHFLYNSFRFTLHLCNYCIPNRQYWVAGLVASVVVCSFFPRLSRGQGKHFFIGRLETHSRARLCRKPTSKIFSLIRPTFFVRLETSLVFFLKIIKCYRMLQISIYINFIVEITSIFFYLLNRFRPIYCTASMQRAIKNVDRKNEKYY